MWWSADCYKTDQWRELILRKTCFLHEKLVPKNIVSDIENELYQLRVTKRDQNSILTSFCVCNTFLWASYFIFTISVVTCSKLQVQTEQLGVFVLVLCVFVLIGICDPKQGLYFKEKCLPGHHVLKAQFFTKHMKNVINCQNYINKNKNFASKLRQCPNT